MDLKKNNAKKYWFLGLALVVIIASVYFLIIRPSAKNVTVKKTTYLWEENINKQFTDAKQVDPNEKTKDLSNEFSTVIKDSVKNNIKLTESTDNKLKYIAETIIVEGDVDAIKKSLEAKGYKELSITDKYKKLTAKKENRQITIQFSVDTTDRAVIEVTL